MSVQVLESASVILGAAGGSRAAWFGALSFEDRCCASAVVATHDRRLDSAMLLDYSTDVHPSDEAKDRKERQWVVFDKLQRTGKIDTLERRTIDPYSFRDLREALDSFVAAQGADTAIIFDITCMTKIHALSLAAALAEWPYESRWLVGYTTPENYGNWGDARRGAGWRDVIVAPLAETAVLFNEAASRGIVITGHEADRLIIALGELEPSGGSILVASADKRPDLRYVSERLNHKVIRQLTRMRSQQWHQYVVGVSDIVRLRKVVEDEIQLAKQYSAPVLLFPYGPKPLLLFSATQLAFRYPEASWFVYPIPASYDLNYSEGIDKTLWFGSTRLRNHVLA
jgi:hypothetical protein